MCEHYCILYVDKCIVHLNFLPSSHSCVAYIPVFQYHRGNTDNLTGNEPIKTIKVMFAVINIRISNHFEIHTSNKTLNPQVTFDENIKRQCQSTISLYFLPKQISLAKLR